MTDLSFKTVNDTDENELDAVQPLTNESADPNIVNRPTERMRERTEELRAEANRKAFHALFGSRYTVVGAVDGVTVQWHGPHAGGAPVGSLGKMELAGGNLLLTATVGPGKDRDAGDAEKYYRHGAPFSSQFSWEDFDDGGGNVLRLVAKKSLEEGGHLISLQIAKSTGNLVTPIVAVTGQTAPSDKDGFIPGLDNIEVTISRGNPGLGDTVTSISDVVSLLNNPASASFPLITAYDAASIPSLGDELQPMVEVSQTQLRRGLNATAFTLSDTELQAFFTASTDNLLQEGDTLCVRFGSLQSWIGRITEGSIAIGNAELLNYTRATEVSVDDDPLLPICRVLNGKLVFVSGRVIPAWSTGEAIPEIDAPTTAAGLTVAEIIGSVYDIPAGTVQNAFSVLHGRENNSQEFLKALDAVPLGTGWTDGIFGLPGIAMTEYDPNGGPSGSADLVYSAWRMFRGQFENGATPFYIDEAGNTVTDGAAVDSTRVLVSYIDNAPDPYTHAAQFQGGDSLAATELCLAAARYEANGLIKRVFPMGDIPIKQGLDYYVLNVSAVITVGQIRYNGYLYQSPNEGVAKNNISLTVAGDWVEGAAYCSANGATTDEWIYIYARMRGNNRRLEFEWSHRPPMWNGEHPDPPSGGLFDHWICIGVAGYLDHDGNGGLGEFYHASAFCRDDTVYFGDWNIDPGLTLAIRAPLPVQPPIGAIEAEYTVEVPPQGTVGSSYPIRLFVEGDIGAGPTDVHSLETAYYSNMGGANYRWTGRVPVLTNLVSATPGLVDRLVGGIAGTADVYQHSIKMKFGWAPDATRWAS